MKEPISLFNERYWKEVKGVEKIAQRRIIGIFHSLFLSLSPSALHFHHSSIPFPSLSLNDDNNNNNNNERKVYMGKEGEVVVEEGNSIFSLSLLPSSSSPTPWQPQYHWSLLLSNHFFSSKRKTTLLRNYGIKEGADEVKDEVEDEGDEVITSFAFINFSVLYFSTSLGRIYSLPISSSVVINDNDNDDNDNNINDDNGEREFEGVELVYAPPSSSDRLIFNQITYLNPSTLILLTNLRSIPSSPSSFSEVHSLHITHSAKGRRGEMRMLSRSTPPYVKILCLNDHLWALTSDGSLHSFPFHPSFLSFSSYVNENVNAKYLPHLVNSNPNIVNNNVNEKDNFGGEEEVEIEKSGKEYKYFTLSYSESKLGNATKIKDIIEDGSFVYGFPLDDCVNDNNDNDNDDKNDDNNYNNNVKEERLFRLSAHRLVVRTTSSLDKVWDSSSPFPSSPLSISFFKPKCREGYKKFGDVVENSKLNFASTVCLLAKEIFDPLSPSDLPILCDISHYFSPFSFPGCGVWVPEVPKDYVSLGRIVLAKQTDQNHQMILQGDHQSDLPNPMLENTVAVHRSFVIPTSHVHYQPLNSSSFPSPPAGFVWSSKYVTSSKQSPLPSSCSLWLISPPDPLLSSSYLLPNSFVLSLSEDKPPANETFALSLQ